VDAGADVSRAAAPSPATAPASHLAPLDRDVVATIALTAYSFVVAAGFARVFNDWEFLRDLGVIVVVGHGLSFLLRRARVSGWVAVPAVAIALVWLIAFQQYRQTLHWLVPGSDTWELFRLETSLVRDQFPTAVAPVQYGAGWAPLAGLMIALVVLLGDTFAFRANGRAEALAPGGVLFVVVAALGKDRHRGVLTAALVATGFLAVVALRAYHDRTRRVELVTRRSTPGGMLPAALGAALSIAVVAAVVGPRLPGATSRALYDTKGGHGGVTELVSPLVDIRSRLVNQKNLEMFRVNSTSAEYWRITSLPEFDGTIFRWPDTPVEEVDGQLADARPGAEEIRQQVQIREMDGKLLPAAADPIAVSPGTDLRWNADIATLALLTDDGLQPGMLFDVVSSSPHVEPDQLRAATSSAPPGAVHLELPDDFPDEIAEMARQVTAGADTTYDAAVALQNWFRSEFTYSLDVQRGHSDTAIESFLIERVGYCEQFAATFAAMARTLGIPSRVAVGFTTGLPGADGWYSVRGKNAHAWPEVWFDGIGWVPFEPTPGRGIPGAQQYTGVAEDQDTSPATGTDEVGTAPRITTPPSFAVPNDPDALPTTLPGSAVPAPGGSTDEPPPPEGGVPLWPFIVIAVLGALVALPPVVRRLRHRVLRFEAPDARVRRAWWRAIDAVRRAGVETTPAMTPRQVASATGRVLPVAARPMWSLAETIDLVMFGSPGSIDLETVGPYGSSVARDCATWARQIEEVADETMTPRDRLRRYFTVWS
jgi:transglutaminase-like putative cysteine protease